MLPHKFYADFVVFEKIILEIKIKNQIAEADFAQAINYIKVSENRLALIVNFGETRLNHKRIIVKKLIKNYSCIRGIKIKIYKITSMQILAQICILCY